MFVQETKLCAALDMFYAKFQEDKTEKQTTFQHSFHLAQILNFNLQAAGGDLPAMKTVPGERIGRVGGASLEGGTL